MNSILPHNRGLSEVKKRTPAGNSVYVAIAGEVVNLRSVLLRNFVLNGQESASNPLLHIHAKRYLQAKKKPPHGQAHLVFADTQANAEKSKELALPHRHPKKIFDNLI